MKYTRNAAEKAHEILRERRTAAETEQRDRTLIAFSAAPEIKTMLRALDKKKFELLRSVGSGKGGASEAVYKLRDETERINRSISEILVSNGFAPDYIDYHYTCPKCRDTGYRDGERCQCFTELLQRLTVEELNGLCNMKIHSFDEFRLDYYPDEEINGDNSRQRMTVVYNNCKGYAEGFETDAQSLFFYGPTGLGKTFLSSCIAGEVMKKGFSVVFFSVPSLFSQLEDEHFGCSDSKTMDLLMSADLVILDDLGSEFKTKFTESKLYEIINGRMNLDKPVIISTNVSVRELQEMYNERLISRVIMKYAPMPFVGRDIRQIMRINSVK